MNLHRFLVPPSAVDGDTVVFSRATARQIRSVLRLRRGDLIIVLDGSGEEFVARLQVTTDNPWARIEERRCNQAEPRCELRLYMGLLKGSHLELVVQRCTEIGVSHFIPVQSARAVSHTVSCAKRQRLEAVIRESVEQSRRGIIPSLGEEMSFADAMTDACRIGSTIVLWENESEIWLRNLDWDTVRAAHTLSLFVGPEGGFTQQEVDLARIAGAQIASLGPRTLRAETAAIVGCALVLDRCD
jgi:16S rRNA (uracil1498-N3)-methyltransferase